MKSQAIVPILCLCLGSCLDFGDDLELSGAEVSDNELRKLPAGRNRFPRGSHRSRLFVPRFRIDDALALKASIPDDERLDFLKNEIFEKVTSQSAPSK